MTQFPTVRALLGEIGVGHVRDVAGNSAQLGRIKNIWQTLGVKLTALVDERTGKISAGQRLAPNAIGGAIAGLKTYLGTQAIEAFEGPNEFNRLERDYNYMGWPADLRAYQSTLYSLVNSDPTISNKMVIAPSIGGPKQDLFYSRLDKLDFAADQGSEHIYPNLVGFEQKANEILGLAKDVVAPGKKINLTETGYHSAINSGAQYVTETVRSKYMARAMTSFATHADIARGFIYQLVDNYPDPNLASPPLQMGLINYNLQPKPTFFAVRNMMHIMCDKNRPFNVGSLNYTLSGNLTDVRRILFQKTNGAFYLLIWLEKLGMVKNSPVYNPPQAVTITFNQKIPLVRAYRPSQANINLSTGNQPTQTFNNPTRLNLSIFDDITILEIVPKGITPPALPNGCSHKAS